MAQWGKSPKKKSSMDFSAVAQASATHGARGVDPATMTRVAGRLAARLHAARVMQRACRGRLRARAQREARRHPTKAELPSDTHAQQARR